MFMADFLSTLRRSFRDANELTIGEVKERPGIILDAMAGYFPLVVVTYCINKRDGKDGYIRK